MAKGFKKGAGGANPLNFKVVGGLTEPANPKENLIWVNTDQKITAWTFAADEPSNPADGMVWFRIGNPSVAEFNALKKNAVQVYPISAIQYEAGVGKSVPVKVYKSGKWIDMETYLYNNGDECTLLTGGWVARDAIVYKDPDSLRIYYETPSGVNRGSGYGSPANLINFTGYTRLEVELSLSSYNGSSDTTYTGEAYMVVLNANKTEVASVKAASVSVKYKSTDSVGKTTAELDISKFNDGLYYVYVGCKNSDYHLDNTIRLYRLQLK